MTSVRMVTASDLAPEGPINDRALPAPTQQEH
jgi:hypothetical protein